ncbi:hypothetical protein E5676_scaffold2460G00130 [Cucumis melo var. makuwa]|uniref:Gag protease polyprotein n=1 Tax=Cucumis melo var. makuwa TaxID=1194695 RepID=A0A5D3BKB1_CUCMM|nr:hypothetical protein E6C27_scaffold1770G00180 [Cucumis melo var. makuwa]TYK00251.1 hypothetical protein E5676_scaffold2460G00130 [Cucumis melo var. makuwa]
MIRVIRRDHSQLDRLSVSFGYTTDQFVLGVPLGSSKTSYVPPGSHVARVHERASSWAEAEVRAKESWRMTRRKMSPGKGARRGGGRGGRGAGCTQLKEQPAVQAANPTTPITQADLTAME